MRYSELYHQSIKKFNRPEGVRDQGFDIAFDIQILIEKVFGLSRSEFWIHKNETICDQNRLQRFYRYVRRLQKQEPLAYIIREKHFYNDTFFVNKKVLIPRPETELLVSQAIQLATVPMDILEIGSGSGNIAISLAKNIRLPVFATESQPGAFRVLQKNIGIHHLEKMVFPILTDLFPRNKRQYDLIVSNPPYVSQYEWTKLPVHIRNYEPRQALVGGQMGYEVIEKIIAGCDLYLKKGGRLLIEIGFNQKPVVEQLLEKYGFRGVGFFKDFNRIDRLASAQL